MKQEQKQIGKGIIWRRFLICCAGAAALACVDQFTKWVISREIKNHTITVIKGFFQLEYAENTGAAWGIFADHTAWLAVFTILASLLIAYLIYASSSRIFSACLVLILSGAAGNVIDRVRNGYVVDFLSFHIFGYRFPNFNFADMCITVGCFLLLIYVLFFLKNGSVIRPDTYASRMMHTKTRSAELERGGGAVPPQADTEFLHAEADSPSERKTEEKD